MFRNSLGTVAYPSRGHPQILTVPHLATARVGRAVGVEQVFINSAAGDGRRALRSIAICFVSRSQVKLRCPARETVKSKRAGEGQFARHWVRRTGRVEKQIGSRGVVPVFPVGK